MIDFRLILKKVNMVKRLLLYILDMRFVVSTWYYVVEVFDIDNFIFIDYFILIIINFGYGCLLGVFCIVVGVFVGLFFEFRS